MKFLYKPACRGYHINATGTPEKISETQFTVSLPLGDFLVAKAPDGVELISHYGPKPGKWYSRQLRSKIGAEEFYRTEVVDLFTDDPREVHIEGDVWEIGCSPCGGTTDCCVAYFWKNLYFLYPYLENCIVADAGTWRYVANSNGYSTGPYGPSGYTEEKKNPTKGDILLPGGIVEEVVLPSDREGIEAGFGSSNTSACLAESISAGGRSLLIFPPISQTRRKMGS